MRHRCALLIAWAITCVGCASSDEPPGHSMGVSRFFYVTNLSYHRRMNALFRRARTVPTDSLSRLYVARLKTPAHQHELSELVACEEIRLGLVYGAAAADLAIERARDSLAHEGYPVRRINALIAGSDRDPTYLGGNPCFANNSQSAGQPESRAQSLTARTERQGGGARWEEERRTDYSVLGTDLDHRFRDMSDWSRVLGDQTYRGPGRSGPVLDVIPRYQPLSTRDR